MEAFVLLVAIVTCWCVVVVFRFLDQPATPLHSWSTEHREAEADSRRAITARPCDGVTRASAPGGVPDEGIRVVPSVLPVLSAGGSVATLSCPTLDVIDRVLGPTHAPFATDPAAATLEQRARDLADTYWSDFVWLTGRIEDSWLQAVVRVLESERAAVCLVEDDPLPTAS